VLFTADENFIQNFPKISSVKHLWVWNGQLRERKRGVQRFRELPHQWKEATVVPIHKKGDKTDCSNYRGISLLSTSYNTLSNNLLATLTPYADDITGDHQCGFRCNISTSDQIFYIRYILQKKQEYNGTVHQLFIDFNKASDSVRREVLYSILIEFGMPSKLDGLIKMCLNDTYSTVCIGSISLTSFLFRMA
jgi:hypothetical protein